MESIKILLDLAGVKLGLLFGGFIGSVLSLRFAGPISRLEKVFMVAGGTSAATFITPIFSAYLDVKGSTEYGIGFLIGVYGMSAMAELYKLLQSGELLKIIKQKLGFGD